MIERRSFTNTRGPDPTRGTDWTHSAACAGDHDLYDAAMPSQPYGPPIDPLAQADALAICAACPVRLACAAAMLPGDDPWHIRGGTTPRQRLNARSHGGEATMGDHACPECGEAYSTPHGLAVHRGKTHPAPHPCTECPRTYRTQRALSTHWSQTHAPVLGRCIRGHASDGSRCVECLRENDRRRHRGKVA
jgi:hypothetical protein